uniref:Histidinol-phosphatase n=1 Tax=Erythrolobus australicus TaxID=1077150 RepID=A0A7S1TNL1_9RHOD|mmetsp:Transcript_520/g.1351  ORF Transcript_520/g.1351 Transcript_520/m.1351 type:complete len:578 (+) Transcript_520:240-1973(+)
MVKSSGMEKRKTAAGKGFASRPKHSACFAVSIAPGRSFDAKGTLPSLCQSSAWCTQRWSIHVARRRRSRGLACQMDDFGSAIPADLQGALKSFANELADCAGSIVKRYYRQRSLIADAKSDASPVTIADREAEQAMRNLIARKYAGHAILGEEHGLSSDFDPAKQEFLWVLDPIDGTKAFMSGKPTFGTLIALLFRGAPVLGLIDQPVSGERWLGTTWDNCTTLNGNRVSSSDHISRLSDSFMYSTTPAMFVGADLIRYRSLASQVRVAMFGADCYAYALLASGFVQLVVEADLKPWDYMALLPVVSCSGGTITDWDGNPLGINSDGRVLAAATSELHAAALKVLQEHRVSNQAVPASVLEKYGGLLCAEACGSGGDSVGTRVFIETAPIRDGDIQRITFEIAEPCDDADVKNELRRLVVRRIRGAHVSVILRTAPGELVAMETARSALIAALESVHCDMIASGRATSESLRSDLATLIAIVRSLEMEETCSALRSELELLLSAADLVLSCTAQEMSSVGCVASSARYAIAEARDVIDRLLRSVRQPSSESSRTLLAQLLSTRAIAAQIKQTLRRCL